MNIAYLLSKAYNLNFIMNVRMEVEGKSNYHLWIKRDKINFHMIIVIKKVDLIQNKGSLFQESTRRFLLSKFLHSSMFVPISQQFDTRVDCEVVLHT